MGGSEAHSMAACQRAPGDRPSKDELLPRRAASWTLQAQDVLLDYRSALRAAALVVTLAVIILSITTVGCRGSGAGGRLDCVHLEHHQVRGRPKDQGWEAEAPKHHHCRPELELPFDSERSKYICALGTDLHEIRNLRQRRREERLLLDLHQAMKVGER